MNATQVTLEGPAAVRFDPVKKRIPRSRIGAALSVGMDA
jgi:hypothetical protein